MKRLSFALITVVAVFTGCKSYEDSFNRNLNSTGLYVANSASNTISMFAADPKSGILNDLGTVAAGTAPVHVAVNSAGTFAYVVNSGSDDVYVYAVDKETRKLTFKSSASAGDNPRMIALHKAGKFAYVLNRTGNSISRYSVESSTGALTSLGAATSSGASTASSIAISAETNSYLLISDSGSANIGLYTISTTTGALSAETQDTFGCADAQWIVISKGSAPFIYGACSGGNVASLGIAGWPPVDTNSTNSTAAGTNPSYVALNDAATHAYVSNSGSGNISIFTISTGPLTAAGTVTACTTPAQIHINSSNFAYLVCNGENKVNAYSVSGSSLNLVGSYSTGTQPTSVAGY
ncbi:MAG TPA: beta-propeller fold lactonase family protein [Turneriella sp.]|nr:beta-propeller fold lactonase family protein [Turneriella sp.]